MPEQLSISKLLNSRPRSGVALYLFLLIIAGLSGTREATAQAGFQAIHTDSLYYYRGPELLPVYFDSFRTDLQDTVWYPARRVMAQTGLPGSCTQNTQAPSWLGDSIRIRQNGENLFYNAQGEPISIRTTPSPGYTYHMYDFPNGNYVEATIVKAGFEKVFTWSDWSKTFQLQVKDAGGNPVSHPLNGKKFVLSLNFGLVRAFNFRDFPNDTTTYHLAGMPFRKMGIDRPRAASLFNLLPGNEFHYLGKRLSCGFAGCRTDSLLVRHFLLKADTSVNADTLWFTWQRSLVDAYNDPVTGQGVLAVTDTLRDTVVLSRIQYLDSLTRTLYFEGPWAGFNITFFADSLGPRMQQRPMRWWAYDSLNHCLSPTPGMNDSLQVVYGDGLGITWYHRTYPGIGFETRKIVYYQKGIETWGSPLDFSILGTVEKPATLPLAIYPNPTRKTAILHVPPMQGPAVLSVFNETGQRLLQEVVPPGSEKYFLNLSGLPAGWYCVLLQTGHRQYRATLSKQ